MSKIHERAIFVRNQQIQAVRDVQEEPGKLIAHKTTMLAKKNVFRMWFQSENQDPLHGVTLRKIALTWALLKWKDVIPEEAHEDRSFEYRQPGLELGMLVSETEKIAYFHSCSVDLKSIRPKFWVTDVYMQERSDETWFGITLDAWTLPTETVTGFPPTITRQIISEFDLLDGDLPIESVPWLIDFPEDGDELLDFLLEPNRRLPVIVVIGKKVEDHTIYCIDADMLADRLQGLAHVVKLPEQYSYEINTSLGENLSCSSDMRMYYPGLSRRDAASLHPVFSREVIDNTQNKDVRGQHAFVRDLVIKLSLYSTRTLDVYNDVPIPSYEETKNLVIRENGEQNKPRLVSYSKNKSICDF